MDFEFVRMYTPTYMEAAKLTFGIAWIGILLSIVIGFVCCLICYYNVPILKRIVGVYILTNSKSIGSPSFLLSYPHQAYRKLITSYDKTTELMTTKHLNIKARHRSSLRNSPPNGMHLIKTDETF